jgi:predicted nucleotidyltransferase
MKSSDDLTLGWVERAATRELLRRLRTDRYPPLLRALLFGSRARGDHDAHSDLDLLFVFATGERQRAAVARDVTRATRQLAKDLSLPLQSWTLCLEDLAPGRRTPMLVDAVEDGVPLWPPDAAPLRLRFTPADACFCAQQLLNWVFAGGPLVRRELALGRRAAAATRIRDDVTRMATAALLLTGDTRHRRAGSLRRFRERLVGTAAVGSLCLPAVEWAAAAHPPDNGRGRSRPPASATAAATAELGYELAAVMQSEVVPWIRRRIRQFTSRDASPRRPLLAAPGISPTRRETARGSVP